MFPKLVRLAIIVMYIPANLEVEKLLVISELVKNWAFESKLRTMMKMQTPVVSVRLKIKARNIKSKRHARTIRVRECNFSGSVQYLLRR